MTELKNIFDEYCAAVSNGKTEEALNFCSEEIKAMMAESLKDPEERKQMEEMAKSRVPVSCTFDHLDEEDSKATVYATGVFTTMKQELIITFLKESGAWKVGNMTFVGNPDEVKRSPDQNYEPADNYNLNKNTTLGGRIVSVKFENDYTLVVIRAMDEENLVFLPNKENLEKAGLKTESLVPWKILEVKGHSHKTNPLKILGEQAEFVERN